MESLERVTDIESRRMALRGVVRLAGEVIAQYWPMRTFVHHNPLHSLEYLPFEETVRRGKQFMGGSGYLPGELYRQYLQTSYVKGLLSVMDPKMFQYDDVAKAAALNAVKKIKAEMGTAVSGNEETKAHRANIVFLINDAMDHK